MVRSWKDLRLHLVHATLRSLVRPRARTDDNLERLGSAVNGWWVPTDRIGPGTTAYCAGAGRDISLDTELLRAGCTVRTLDPTPLAITYVESLEITDPEFKFIPVGLWDETAELQFFEPDDASHVSFSALNLQQTESSVPAPVMSLEEHRSALGDEKVDLLKIDIEGSEYRVLDSMIDDGIFPEVLLVEFDQPMPPRKTLSYIRRLRRLGYRLAKVEWFNYTFILDGEDRP